MEDEIKEILQQIKNVIDYNEIQNIYETVNLECEDAKLLLDYITNLQEENEREKQFTKNCGFTNQQQLALAYLDYKSRNEKAILIYENRNSTEYKKKRFMEGKNTSDLMYEVLQGVDKDE